MPITHSVITTIGSFKIYRKHDVNPGEMTVDLPGVYWNDKVSPQDHGPFNSTYEAMEHYRDTLLMRKTGQNQPTIGFIKANPNEPDLCPVIAERLKDIGKLITVDFANKRRS